MEIIPRGAWGARYDNGAGDAPLPAGEVWLHHSVTKSAGEHATAEADALSIRQLEQIGEDRFGAGISYTWPVCQSGRIFEGHGVHRQGTHTGGRNDIARAVCLVGDYSTTAPTRAQVRAVAWLLQHAHRRGWIKAPALRGGHRDVRRLTGDSIVTACPGDGAYAAIPEINRLAAGPPITKENDDMAWRDELIPYPSQPYQPAGTILAYAHYYTVESRGIQTAHGAMLVQIMEALGIGGDSASDAWARIADAAERGAREGVTGPILARLDALEEALQADDAEQARAGAREVLVQLRESLPAA